MPVVRRAFVIPIIDMQHNIRRTHSYLLSGLRLIFWYAPQPKDTSMQWYIVNMKTAEVSRDPFDHLVDAVDFVRNNGLRGSSATMYAWSYWGACDKARREYLS